MPRSATRAKPVLGAGEPVRGEGAPSGAHPRRWSPSAAVLLAVAAAPALAGPNAAIHVDQVGYPAAARKMAIVAAEPAERRFSVHRAGDGALVLEGELSPPTADPDSGDRVRLADFSALGAPGRYELRVPGLGRRAAFDVRGAPYRGLLRPPARSS